MKEMINKMKKQPTEREKIFANYMSDKGLMSKTHEELKHKELIQLSIKKNFS